MKVLWHPSPREWGTASPQQSHHSSNSSKSLVRRHSSEETLSVGADWECSVAKSTDGHGSDAPLLFPSGLIPPKGFLFALSFSGLGDGMKQVKCFLDFSMRLCSVFEPYRASAASYSLKLSQSWFVCL